MNISHITWYSLALVALSIHACHLIINNDASIDKKIVFLALGNETCKVSDRA